MPIQSLGIFDSVFDWVCDKIFDPIIDWLGKILNTIFEWILETIVIPLLLPVFQLLWDVVLVNIADIFFTFIYGGYCQMLWLLDQLQSGFDILIGLKDITYYSESAGQKTQSTLLEYFMYNDIVRNALLSITFIALALSIIFSIYSMMRSTLDFDFEGKRPVGKVLNSVAKMMIAFLLVPVISVVGVQLASIILKQTSSAITGGDSSLGRWVLTITSMDAGRDAKFTDMSAANAVEPWKSLLYGGTDYVTFGTQIHISEVDYILGYASVIFMLIVMVICLFTFIKRIFDVILLYITSPYFVSTIVLDDGEKFKRWRETFIARILVGYGSAIGLRIFLMMVPVIMSDDLQIFDSVAGDLVGGYVVRLVFILGGMYAVHKSSTLLTGIISSSVAADENMSNALLGGLTARGASKLGHAAIGAVGAIGKGLSEKSQRRKAAAAAAAAKSSKFKGDLAPSKSKFNAGEYSKSLKSDFTGNLGLKEDQINDDYISDVVKAEKAAKEAEKKLNPLSELGEFKDLNFDEDYLSKDFTSYSKYTGDIYGGDVDTTIINDKDNDMVKFDEFGNVDALIQSARDERKAELEAADWKPEFTSDAIKVKGDQAIDDAVSVKKTANFDDVLKDNYKRHDSATPLAAQKFSEGIDSLDKLKINDYESKDAGYMDDLEKQVKFADGVTNLGDFVVNDHKAKRDISNLNINDTGGSSAKVKSAEELAAKKPESSDAKKQTATADSVKSAAYTGADTVDSAIKKESSESSDFVLDPFESLQQTATSSPTRESAEDILANAVSKQTSSSESSDFVLDPFESLQQTASSKRSDHKNDSGKF